MERSVYSDSSGTSGNSSSTTSGNSTDTNRNNSSNPGGSGGGSGAGALLGGSALGALIGAMLIEDLAHAVQDGGGLNDIDEAAGDVGADNALAPDGALVGTLAAIENNVMDDLHAALEGVSDAAGDPASSIVHGLTAFGEDLGFGNVGVPADDLLSSVLAAPSAALEGEAVAAASNILEQTSGAISSAGNFANTIVDALNLSDPLDTGVIGQAGDLLQTLDDDIGNITGPVGGAVGGTIDGIGGLTGNVGGIVDDLSNVTGNLAGITNDVGNVAGNLGSGPLLDVDGNGPSGDLINAVVNSDTSGSGPLIDARAADDGSSSQSHNLIDADAGPTSDNGQGSVAVLSPDNPDSGNTGQFNIIDVGPDGPTLVNADLATDDDVLNDEVVAAAPLGEAIVMPGLPEAVPQTPGFDLMI